VIISRDAAPFDTLHRCLLSADLAKHEDYVTIPATRAEHKATIEEQLRTVIYQK